MFGVNLGHFKVELTKKRPFKNLEQNWTISLHFHHLRGKNFKNTHEFKLKLRIYYIWYKRDVMKWKKTMFVCSGDFPTRLKKVIF